MDKISVIEIKRKHFKKHLTAMRYWLLGRKYYKALKAMEFALGYHSGNRKDGVTPAFQHQLSMAHYARVYETSLMHPEGTYTTLFLHDIKEDFNVSGEEITKEFGAQIAHSVSLMTRKYRNKKIPIDEYYNNIGTDSIASVGKGCDRIHNFQSMVNVFTQEKQIAYMEEAEKHILPMIKIARRSFLEQEAVYENIKIMLLSQIELIKVIHEERETKEGSK